MADIEFIETPGVLGIKITDPEQLIMTEEIQILQRNLTSAGTIFKSKIETLIANLETRGASVEQTINILLDDFENDGQIFGALKNAWTKSGSEFVVNTDNRLTYEQFEQDEAGQDYTWICALINTCDDCLPLHGESKSMAEFEADPGLPASGWSVCRGYCQCVLIPSSVAEGKAELQAPLKRVKRKISQIGKEKNVKSVKRYVNRKLGSIRNTKDPIRKEYRKLLPGFKR